MLKVITGKLCSGKSTRLLKYISSHGPSNFFGYTSYCNEERTKYWIKNIETGDSKLLLWVSDTPKYSRFDYSKEVFSFVNSSMIKRLASEHSGQTAVLDEVGRIEALGGGFAPTLEALRKYSIKHDAIIVVRENFIHSLELKDYQLID